MGATQYKLAIQEILHICDRFTFGTKQNIRSLLLVLEEEAEAPPFFYTLNTIASELKTSPPSRDILFDILRDHGYDVWRTHIDPAGFKTNATKTTIINAFNEAKLHT